MKNPVGLPARLFTVVLGATALLTTSALYAQSTGSKPLEEIVVTAQFREENLQQTPVAITAVTGDMMNARSQTNITEVSNQAPNVTLKPQGQAFGPSMAAYIRGVGQYDFNPAYEPGVGLYVDDVYYSSLTGSVFDLLDLDRVEILRGPQGTLAGKNSIGGAIKLYSKKPGEGNSHLSVTYGSRDRLDFRGSADFNITDSLAARIAGVSKKQDGYVKRLDYGCVHPTSNIPADLPQGSDCVVAKEGQIDYNGIRAMLNWDNGGPVRVNLIADYTHNDRTAAGNVLLYANYQLGNDINPYSGNIPYDDRFVPPEGSYYNYASYISYADNGLPTSRAQGRSKYESWGASATVDVDLTDTMTLKSITAYRSWNTRFSNDDDVSPLAHSFGRGNLDFWQFSQELRLNGSLGPDNQVDYTLGGFYMDQRTTYATFQDLRYAGLSPFKGDDPVNADNKSVFAHVSWYATDKLTVLGGLRYSDESKDYTFSRRTRDGSLHPLLGPLDGVTGKYSGNRVDYRAGIQYNWTDTLMTYFQTATGFKGGGINPRPFFPSQVQPFGAEKLTSYEVGVKSDLWQHRARLNVAAFYSDYNDIQLVFNSCPNFSPFPGAPCALPQNAGDAHMKGVEVETTVNPTQRLSLDGSLSYLDFDYTHIAAQVGGVTRDMVPPDTPKWKWSAGVQYDIPLPGGMGTLTPRFDASYQSDIYTNSVNRPINRIDGYVLANARLTWVGPEETWQGAFQVTNLFDKYYYLTKFDLTGAGAGFVSGQPGHPREWAVTIRRNFD